jgi:hypothetical protein
MANGLHFGDNGVCGTAVNIIDFGSRRLETMVLWAFAVGPFRKSFLLRRCERVPILSMAD